MRITTQHISIRSTHVIDALIEQRILGLQPMIAIEAAEVRVERQNNVSPPFRVSVRLVIPGPDLVAEAREHTVSGAVASVMHHLELKIKERKQKPGRRVRSQLQSPAGTREVRRRVGHGLPGKNR